MQCKLTYFLFDLSYTGTRASLLLIHALPNGIHNPRYGVHIGRNAKQGNQLLAKLFLPQCQARRMGWHKGGDGGCYLATKLLFVREIENKE